MSQFRLMSFNLRGSFLKHDGENIWEKRAELNIETVRHAAAHLIAFQELQLGNLQAYERALPEYEFLLGPKYNNHAPYCYLSVFWRPQTLAKIASGEFWISETPERHSGGWDTEYIRAAHWVRFRTQAGGHEFVFINTHLDNTGERARSEGARIILEQLPKFAPSPLPVIIAGDFNCNPGSDPYQRFIKGGFADTFRVSGLQDGEQTITFHAFKGAFNGRDSRIDWILTRDGTSKIKPTQFQIVTTAKPPLYPSDHYPIHTDLEWVQ